MNLGAGIFYPEVVFDFEEINGSPPSSVGRRLNAGEEYPQPITLRYGHGYFVTWPDVTIFVNKPYKLLHMKEMRYTWEGGEGVFLKDITFKLPDRWKEYQPPVDTYELKSGTTNVWVKRADAAEIERKREEERKQEEREVEPYYYYYEKNGWYWLGKSPMSVDKKTGFPEVRFSDLFRGKRPGDTFYFTIEMVYSFDDDPEITQNVIYEVKAFEGSYVSPFGF